MEEKSSNQRIAVLSAIVVVCSALMAWALLAMFKADSARYGDMYGNEDYYAEEEDTEPMDEEPGELEPEKVKPSGGKTPASGTQKPQEPPKKAAPAEKTKASKP